MSAPARLTPQAARRYARALAAAVIAATALITAANAGPAQAAEPERGVAVDGAPRTP
ncbi:MULTISPECIES: hypothetical protein [unclassified Streptomyces]|uniref:hypothetical protein n=1 Tax=unclassified Streptomyces TaxID=2593676 RepID=UPI0018E9D47C|nr:hypothetical protein [Streptomyces sp. TSRI0107]